METSAIRVGLVGAGAMGYGIAKSVARLDGFDLAFVADVRRGAAEAAARSSGAVAGTSLDELLEVVEDVDVLVEASSSVYGALRHSIAAVRRGIGVVLMNAEVDLAFGVELRELAAEHGAIVSMDAGDQNGVLLRCAEELADWGLTPVLYGNLKGYLRHDATQASLRLEAAERNLTLRQCCAYTDGSKLNVEMALVGNATGAGVLKTGMDGPACSRVSDALSTPAARAASAERPLVDYLLGAEPGGGVYLVGDAADDYDAEMLRYYKVPSDGGSRFLFHRPSHLCHLETPTAVRRVVRERRPLPDGPMRRELDVYAFAKRPLRAGHLLEEALGADEVHGLVDRVEGRDADGCVPQCLLQALIERDGPVRLRADVPEGGPLRFEGLDAPWQDTAHASGDLLAAALA